MRTLTLLAILTLAAASIGAAQQGTADPLTMQGLDHTTLQSAASRAAGGITIGLPGSAPLMFANAASLSSLTSVQFSIGGAEQFWRTTQVQQYAPLKYYSNFSLLMEGLTGYIPNPDTSLPGVNSGDTVQRPFDAIGPNWSRKHSKGFPLQALLAVPFTLGEMKFAAGAGWVEYANLTSYYQNNNLLSPNIGNERPIPIPLPPNNPDSSFPAQWYQYVRARDGSIRGYGGALSGQLTEKLSVGVSGLILKGTTDDAEQLNGRGTIVFFNNYFRLDSLHYRAGASGTSDFSGSEFAFSALYRTRHITLGFTAKPPSTITRKFDGMTAVDTGTGVMTTHASGEDKMRLPWRGTAGLALLIRDNITIGLEYELRPFTSAAYITGTETNPWTSADQVHIGVEYLPLDWLAVRGGVRGQTEVFEPAGNPIAGEPVSATVYSAGVGLALAGLRWNVAYEYTLLKYDEMYQSNVNLNSDRRHAIVADVQYDIPWTH